MPKTADGYLYAATRWARAPVVYPGKCRVDAVHLTSQTGQMKTFGATEFKTGCLALLDRVSRTGDTITITKRGRPIAQLVPIASAGLPFPQDRLVGTVAFSADIVSPVLPPGAWDVERRRRR